MELEERRLLHFPDLTLALLKASGQHSATLDDAADILARDRRKAGEPAEIPRASVLPHLDVARRHLAAAGLLALLDRERFRITPRGRAVLDRHPDGIDDSVLVQFPEFRDWLARTRPPHAREDTRGREFQTGSAAYSAGQDLTDNPYSPDTAQHAAWEDGWLEGDRRSREGPRPGKG